MCLEQSQRASAQHWAWHLAHCILSSQLHTHHSAQKPGKIQNADRMQDLQISLHATMHISVETSRAAGLTSCTSVCLFIPACMNPQFCMCYSACGGSMTIPNHTRLHHQCLACCSQALCRPSLPCHSHLSPCYQCWCCCSRSQCCCLFLCCHGQHRYYHTLFLCRLHLNIHPRFILMRYK